MEMPEATVNEDRGAVSRKDEIRSARQIPAVETVAKALGEEPVTHGDLDPGVSGPDGRHHPTSRRSVHRVGQDVSLTRRSGRTPTGRRFGRIGAPREGNGAPNGRSPKKPTRSPVAGAVCLRHPTVNGRRPPAGSEILPEGHRPIRPTPPPSEPSVSNPGATADIHHRSRRPPSSPRPCLFAHFPPRSPRCPVAARSSETALTLFRVIVSS